MRYPYAFVPARSARKPFQNERSPRTNGGFWWFVRISCRQPVWTSRLLDFLTRFSLREPLGLQSPGRDVLAAASAIRLLPGPRPTRTCSALTLQGLASPRLASQGENLKRPVASVSPDRVSCYPSPVTGSREEAGSVLGFSSYFEKPPAPFQGLPGNPGFSMSVKRTLPSLPAYVKRSYVKTVRFANGVTG